MSDILQDTILVQYETRRCSECGTRWAVEKFRPGVYACPCCYDRKVSSYVELLASKDRQIAALRGTITRLTKEAPANG